MSVTRNAQWLADMTQTGMVQVELKYKLFHSNGDVNSFPVVLFQVKEFLSTL